MNLSESDFDFIDCQQTKACMMNGCWAVDQTGLWDWLKNYEVNPKYGFMFAIEPEINVIGNMMEKDGAPYQQAHSGASFGLTMRNLYYIAQNGFEAYKTICLEYKRIRESAVPFQLQV
jgi:hypothetical protein